MLAPNQYIKTKWHYKNKEHFESRGYIFTKFGDEIIIKAEDLRDESHEMVDVICDGCGKLFQREYRAYIKNHDSQYGDCCRKCCRKIAMRTNKERYGVDWCLQRDDFKEKQKQTCLEKYGVEYISQSKEFRNTVENTCIKKFGVKNISQADVIKKKKADSFYKNGTCPTSKPQLLLFETLKEMYGACELNYPVGKCSLDCFVIVNNVKIDVEFDGSYWHSGKEERDKRRNYYLIGRGYKVLRYISSLRIPSKEQIEEDIKHLITTDDMLLIKNVT